MLRGDDVAELQRRLNLLGFDAGREDGILGGETESRDPPVPAQRGNHRRRSLRSGDDRRDRPRQRTGRRVGREPARARDAAPRAPPARRPARLPRRRARDERARDRGPHRDGQARRTRRPRHLGRRPQRVDRARRTTSAPAPSSLSRTAAIPASAARTSRAARSVPRAATASPTRLTESLRTVLDDVDEPVGRTYRFLRETRMTAVVCELVGRDEAARADHADDPVAGRDPRPGRGCAARRGGATRTRRSRRSGAISAGRGRHPGSSHGRCARGPRGSRTRSAPCRDGRPS